MNSTFPLRSAVGYKCAEGKMFEGSDPVNDPPEFIERYECHWNPGSNVVFDGPLPNCVCKLL